ncbi:hypothetical protein GSI_12635 [Ganoderma sinense ZZ0214-1]|uniref:Uncharacterized protein n=1 Tax=Ganoderma sinense ZZ0214-1 TaxID=1077348 RepID=A0A2G8RTB4_9APHY|nr:hypothetical protein GSI_12635 [Ganoderma sinense ZZ0214-1]
MENNPATHWQWLIYFWMATEDALDHVQITSGRLWCTKVAATLPLSPTPLRPGGKKLYSACDHVESTSHARGLMWIQKCRDEVVADVRRRLVVQEMPTVEELVRRSVVQTLKEKPWCAACSDIAWDIVRLGTTFRERMVWALDKVPLII